MNNKTTTSTNPKAGTTKATEAESYNKNFEDETPPSHEDGVLESIGKAVTAPVRDAADEGSTEEADRKKP